MRIHVMKSTVSYFEDEQDKRNLKKEKETQ